MMVKAESAQERAMSATMSETAAAHGEAVESARREKKARRRPDDGTEFCGVRRTPSGKYGAQIWDPLRRADVWLGTFGTAEEAAGAFDAAAVELRGVAQTKLKIPAAVHPSACLTAAKVQSAEEQGLTACSCEIAKEHGDVVGAEERRGKEALLDVHEYYKLAMDSHAGRNYGKKSRFFQQLEALQGPAGMASPAPPPATAVGVPGMVEPPTVLGLAEPPFVGATAGMATLVVGGNLSFSKSSTEDSDDEGTRDMGERGKRKRTSEGGAATGAGNGKMMGFFEGLMTQALERQEAMQQRFLEAIEKREQDRMIREEAWRRQEMARLAREQEILAQERAMSATRNAAVLSFIQKTTGQSIPIPPIAAHPIRFMPPPPQSSQTHATPMACAAAPLPSSQLPARTLPQKPTTMPPPAYHAPVVHQSSTGFVMPAAEMPHDASGSGGGVRASSSSQWRKEDASGSGGGVRASSSSSPWLKAELQALIQLHSNLDMRRKGLKAPLWDEISAGMRRMGYSRSSKQCRVKWGNMNTYFKKVKDSNKKRPHTCPSYFHQFEALYHNKAAMGSIAGAGGVAAEHANAALQDRIEASTVTAPISQTAPQPHTLPPVGKNGVTNNDSNGHDVGGVSKAVQMQASNGGSVAGNRFVVREESSMDLLNSLPDQPVRSSTISGEAQVEEFFKGFTDVVA